MKKTLLSVLTASVAFAAFGGIVAYPEYPKEIERDYAYAVRVSQGAEKRRLVVYNHCEKSALSTRTRGGDVNRRFCEFAFDGGPVRVDIAVCEDVKSYAVFPSRLGLKSEFRNGVISVFLDRPCNFGVRLNDYDKTILSVFAEAPEDPAKVPKKGDPRVMYVEGWVDPPGEEGVTIVEDPVKEVYIAPGAVLNSRLVVKSRGAYIHGRGMILDPFSDVFRFDQTKNTRRGFLNVVAEGAVVEDVKLVDARTFNYCSWAKDVVFRNVKALASMMCSDGMTNGGRNLRVEGAWLYVGDNALVVSGIKGGALYRDVAIGTSCNAIFPQGSNEGVVMENIDIFRADEGCIKNSYNGVLRRNTKWNEMNAGEAKKEPGPQDLVHQTQAFFFKNFSAIDCVLFSRFFSAGNMGTLPKTFGMENVSMPYTTGRDDWRTAGQTNGHLVAVMHDSSKWLDSGNYTLAITNFWVGGARLDSIPADKVKNGDRIAVSVVNTRDKSAIPSAPDRHVVNWTCPWKVYVGSALRRDVRLASPKKGERRIEPSAGANLLADRASTRSAWQRCPSWLVKFDATEKVGGSRVYRLTQCEKNAGILNVFTDAFLEQGGGRYRLSFEAKAKRDSPVDLEAVFLSNEKKIAEKLVIPCDGEWRAFAIDVDLDFDIAATDLVALHLKTVAPTDELCFKNLSLAKKAK